MYKPISERTMRRRTQRAIQLFYEECAEADSIVDEPAADNIQAVQDSDSDGTSVNEGLLDNSSMISLEPDRLEEGHSSSSDDCSLADTSIYSPSEGASSTDTELDEIDSAVQAVPVSLSQGLAHWACSYNISHSALQDLLLLMRANEMDLPRDPRTLLNTVRSESYEIKRVAGGSYYYIGLQNALSSVLPTKRLAQLTIDINADGLPLFRSSNLSLWPILALVNELREFGPFVVALFVGAKKPSSAHEYLQDFIQEMQHLLVDGITVQTQHIKVVLHAFICDAPARSFLKGTKSHTGYYCCERCIQKGENPSRGRIIFPQLDAPLRTDLSFRNMENASHHNEESPLNQLGIGMVSQFVLDYQHLVCLGVVRKMINYWLGIGPLTLVKLHHRDIKMLSDRLSSFRRNIPKEFSRKPRPITEAKLWKSTEYRQFLLYTGPVCLRGIVNSNIYANFLLLSVCIRCLLHDDLYGFEYSYIDELMKIFVREFSLIYGRQSLVYNVHHLIHLVSDAKRYGSLENISCFPFESMLGRMKKLARRPGNPCAQILRRIKEKESTGVPLRGHLSAKAVKQEFAEEYFSGPNPQGCRQFRRYSSNDLHLSLNDSDNCVQINGSICLIYNILLSQAGRRLVVYRRFKRHDNFFTSPFNSCFVGIYVVGQLSLEFHTASISNIRRKFVLLPDSQDRYVAFSLIHKLEQ